MELAVVMGRFVLGLAVFAIGVAILVGSRLWWRYIASYNRRVSGTLFRNKKVRAGELSDLRLAAEGANRWLGSALLLVGGALFAGSGVELMVTALLGRS